MTIIHSAHEHHYAPLFAAITAFTFLISHTYKANPCAIKL